MKYSGATTELLIAGKPELAYYEGGYLYAADSAGVSIGEPLRPASSPDLSMGYRSNTRLVKDSSGNLYQIHGIDGLIRLDTAEAVVPPRIKSFEGNPNVYIGMHFQGSSNEFLGAPLLDAEFHPNDPNVVFVVPVVVEGPHYDEGETESRYRAAAKLRLSGNGEYTIEALYGLDPHDDPVLNGWPPSTTQVKVQWPREIEVDALGNVYVLSSHYHGLHVDGCNDWILTYDELDPGSEQRINISGQLRSPTALLVSEHDPDVLYVASSIDDQPDASARIWRYTIDRSSSPPAGLLSPEAITAPCPGHPGDPDCIDRTCITSLVEAPNSGKLYAAGFSIPRLCMQDGDGYVCEVSGDVALYIATPLLATIDPDDVGAANTVVLNCHELSLPISLAFVGADCPGDLDGDQDVDLSDLAQLLSNYGTTSGAAYEDGDFDNDGDVDLGDLAAMLSVYGDPCP